MSLDSTNTRVILTTATPNELGEIVKFLRTHGGEHMKNRGEEAIRRELSQGRVSILREVMSPDGLSARLGEVIGTIANFKVGNVVELAMGCVHETWRGNGLHNTLCAIQVALIEIEYQERSGKRAPLEHICFIRPGNHTSRKNAKRFKYKCSNPSAAIQRDFEESCKSVVAKELKFFELLAEGRREALKRVAKNTNEWTINKKKTFKLEVTAPLLIPPGVRNLLIRLSEQD